jgi:hypothetical protein
MNLDILLPQTRPPVVLADADYAEAAEALGCEVAAIRAVADVETGARGPFDRQGRPTILFERHLFHRWTGGRFDAQAPDISNPVAGGYGTYDSQYDRLRRAALLDFDAALASASWGMFQILAQYHLMAGFATADDMVQAMRTGIRAHLLAFAHFVACNPLMFRAIRAKDWVGVAKAYNGRSEADHGYDAKLEKAYGLYA